MRNPDRLDDFYEALKKLHKEYVPDWRFSQLIMNLMYDLQTHGKDPFYYEEDMFIECVEEYLKRTVNK